MIERAVVRAIEREPDLVRASAAHAPKAWGAFAAAGILAFKELEGRAATDAERRAIWAGLWHAVEDASTR